MNTVSYSVVVGPLSSTTQSLRSMRLHALRNTYVQKIQILLRKTKRMRFRQRTKANAMNGWMRVTDRDANHDGNIGAVPSAP
jgi:hypothetical protein